MKKSVKSGIIWGTTLAVVGGIAAGIAIPVIKAQNKVTSTNPMAGFNEDKEIIAGTSGQPGITGKQMIDALNATGVKDSSLLSKVQYQLAFHLYDSEQEGSVKLQKIYTEWDQYNINKKINDFLVKTLQLEDTVKVIDNLSASELAKKLYMYSDSEEKRQALYDALTKVADNKVSAKEQAANTDALKTTVASYKTTISSFKDEWEKTKNFLKQINNTISKQSGGIDYNSSSFSSDFPKVLNLRENIKNKQQQIYNERKSSFISSYKGAGEGTTEWVKQLPTAFGGATTEKGAVEFLVNQQISSSAWSKYSYKVNTEFTVEQLKSNIFKDILGTVDISRIDATTNILSYQQTDKVVFRGDSKQEDSDKLYFFSCGTKNPTDINATDENKIPTQNLDKIVKINNAILGWKQDTANPLKAWTITKDQLTKLFTFFGTDGKFVVDEWNNIFAGFTGEEDANGHLTPADQLTKTLIAYFSGTTDGSQFKMGDLGWTTQLTALKSYYNGFSLGVAAALDSYSHPSNPLVTHTVDGRAAQQGGTNFLGSIMNKLKDSFNALWSKTMPTIQVGSIKIGTGTTPVVRTDFSQVNKEIANFVSKLTDDEIALNFGSIIRDAMMGINVDTTGKIVAPGTGTIALGGLPAAIKISETAATDATWMVNADEMGMHIIRIFTLADPHVAIQEMKKEFVKAAEKQDEKLISTDWSKFISGSFTTVNQIADALRLDLFKKTNPTDDEKAELDKLKAIVKNVEDSAYASGANGATTDADKERLVKDTYALIDSLVSSQQLSDISSSYRNDMYTWLAGKIDAKLWTELGDYTIMPDEIYSAIQAAGGK